MYSFFFLKFEENMCEWAGERDYKGARGNFWGDVYVPYLDCDEFHECT